MAESDDDAGSRNASDFCHTPFHLDILQLLVTAEETSTDVGKQHIHVLQLDKHLYNALKKSSVGTLTPASRHSYGQITDTQGRRTGIHIKESRRKTCLCSLP